MKTLTESDFKYLLENDSLYVWREFNKPSPHIFINIREVDAYCQECEQTRPFQSFGLNGDPEGIRFYPANLTLRLEFECVSCQRERREYLVEKVDTVDTIRIQKYGERPRKKLDRNRGLQQFFKDDLDNYEKAVVCLLHEYGMGAFAYFRRIVENNICKLLDLAHEDAESSGEGTNVMAALTDLRKDSPMAKKIEIANQALPKYLKPDGLNPLGRLYQVLSEGVHELSDDECLNRAKEISECLGYLVSELASRKRRRTKYKMTVGGL